jgi:hypothetical protein
VLDNVLSEVNIHLRWEATQGSTLTFWTTCPSGKCKVKTGCPKDFYLPNVLYINKTAKCLIVRRARLHRNLLARHIDLVVPGKRTVLSVEPCLITNHLQGLSSLSGSNCSEMPLRNWLSPPEQSQINIKTPTTSTVEANDAIKKQDNYSRSIMFCLSGTIPNIYSLSYKAAGGCNKANTPFTKESPASNQYNKQYRLSATSTLLSLWSLSYRTNQ